MPPPPAIVICCGQSLRWRGRRPGARPARVRVWAVAAGEGSGGGGGSGGAAAACGAAGRAATRHLPAGDAGDHLEQLRHRPAARATPAAAAPPRRRAARHARGRWSRAARRTESLGLGAGGVDIGPSRLQRRLGAAGGALGGQRAGLGVAGGAACLLGGVLGLVAGLQCGGDDLAGWPGGELLLGLAQGVAELVALGGQLGAGGGVRLALLAQLAVLVPGPVALAPQVLGDPVALLQQRLRAGGRAGRATTPSASASTGTGARPLLAFGRSRPTRAATGCRPAAW